MTMMMRMTGRRSSDVMPLRVFFFRSAVLLFDLIKHRKLRGKDFSTFFISRSFLPFPPPLTSSSSAPSVPSLSPCGALSRTDADTGSACSRRPGLPRPPAGGASQLSPAEVACSPRRDAVARPADEMPLPD